MAYSEQLADRIRTTLNGERGWAERRMFGGLCFTLNGHMCCGIVGETLMLRLGEERASAALKKPHTREMDFTGRPLKGMIYLDPQGIASARALRAWIHIALKFARTLPPKQPQASKTSLRSTRKAKG
jgi:TfoX/Sxy family transcriptional regulator of competence genes